MRFLLIVLLFVGIRVFAQDQTLVSFGSEWSYNDTGANLGSAWRASAYDDSAWPSGAGKLGYGEGNEATVISYGGDPDNRHITTYFRHSFTIGNVADFPSYLIRLIKDDGALVYVNGQEVMRSNFGTNSYDYLDEAYSSVSGSEETTIWEEFIDPSYFQSGTNVIAVEVHQYKASSSDVSFDLELIGHGPTPSLYRQPYLQLATENSITIKWMTDVPTNSRVKYGTMDGVLLLTVDSIDLTMNHEITLSNLSSDTKYYYSIGTSAQTYAGEDDQHYFHTNPVIGERKDTRIWITGDAGTGKGGQLDVRDSYVNHTGTEGRANLWLMLGDNAYEHGRQADYQMGLFNVYPEIMRNTVSFPCSGNHEFYGEASPITETGTYYDIFALPKEGEAGGVPSGTESYFSYDYGNIHFICLESYALSRDSSDAMGTWLKSDLASNTADWTIVYWHYAPYTKVDHDSDDPDDHSGRAIEMRENFNPIIERYGVDVVLGGHSHGYERSYLLDGHYDSSATLLPSMILDETSGNDYTTGAYQKPHPSSHEGAVYVVCGNSGKVGGVHETGPHPAMHTTNTDYLGSVLIDISGNQLEGKFLDENGVIQDYFHIQKPLITPATTRTQKKVNIDVFPNPSSDELTITIPTPTAKDDYLVTLYGMNGDVIFQKVIDQITTTINMAGIASGTYTLKIRNGDQLNQSRLVVRQ